ncbi:MAG: LacI family DNA-binding transcriptional regulator [Phycisphaerae bacterium]|nr:LacI family DNA-binding transcriptional regulator [Phycisphaerae bacterium]
MIDIAKRAGVSVGTASTILRRKPGRYAEKTRRAVMEAAKALDYHPSAAAQALVTKRTGHIGFILSEAVEGGLRNNYFATILSGVERACRETGHGLNVSLYNLSNIDTFVFPSKVAQRSVDGLVLTGNVEAAVVEKFRSFNIPCVCVGDSVEVGDIVPTVATDIVGGLLQAVLHAHELGHRRVGYHVRESRRPREIAVELARRVQEQTAGRCELIPLETAGAEAGYAVSRKVAALWQSLPESHRPTVLITSDQVAQGLLRWFRSEGLYCPKDIGLICEGDTELCEFADPPLTAIRQNQDRLGYLATKMLIEHLDQDKPLTVDMSRNDYPCNLVIRNSCTSAG